MSAATIENIVHLSLSGVASHAAAKVKVPGYVVFDHFPLELSQVYRIHFYSLMLLTSGRMRYTVGAEQFAASGGDIVFSPAARSFAVNFLSEDFKATYICFSSEFVYHAGFNYKSNDILKNISAGMVNVIREEDHLFRQLQFYVGELARLNRHDNDDPYFNEKIWHYFSLMIYMLNDHSGKDPSVLINSFRKDEITTAFFTLVNQHFRQHHDVRFYADQLFITPKYLSHIIKLTRFKTPRDVINQALIIEAKLLLRNSTANVNQVTEELYFTDQSMFSKFFRKHTGQSPSSYRSRDLF